MLETLQRLRIRYPRWIVAWGIYFSDAVFSAMAFIWILAPIFTNGTQYSFLDLFFIFAVMQTVLGLIYLPLNLYRSEPTVSRFYEIQQIVRTTFLITLLAVFIDALKPGVWLLTAQEILRYWLVLAFGLIVSRCIFRTLQKYLLTKGYGLRKTVIVGINERAFKSPMIL